MNEINFEEIAEIFKALAHPTRAKIVAGLLFNNDGCECNVSKMVKGLNIAQPTVSQHLNILKSAKIIEGYRKGNQICYKVINNQVKAFYSTIKETY